MFQLFFFVFFLAVVKWSYVSKELQIDEPDRFAIYSRHLFFVVCFFIILLNIKKIKLKGCHLICLLWFLIMIPVMFLSHASIQFYSICLMWPLVFEAMYFLCLNDRRFIISIRRLFIPIFLISIFYFLKASFLTNFGIQTNMVFYAILCFPWLLLYDSKFVNMLFMVIISLLALLSMKRSMMLIVALFWVIIGLNFLFRTSNKFLATFAFLSILAFSYFVFTEVDEFLGGSLTARLEENEDEKGGGREDIYLATGLLIIDSSPLELITGHGHHAVSRDSILEHSAHNDFMEILYDYGALEFILYIFLWIYLFRKMFYLNRTSSKYRLSYLASMVCFVVMSVISHLVLYANYFFFLVLYWAAIEAITGSERKLIYKQTRSILN